MATKNICDKCGKEAVQTHYMEIKMHEGKKELKADLCEKHWNELRGWLKKGANKNMLSSLGDAAEEVLGIFSGK